MGGSAWTNSLRRTYYQSLLCAKLSGELKGPWTPSWQNYASPTKSTPRCPDKIYASRQNLHCPDKIYASPSKSAPPIYVRFFDGDCIWEDLLGLIPLGGHTTGEILSTKITSFFELDLEHVSMLVTDGAPSMAGKKRGLAARMATVATPPEIGTLPYPPKPLVCQAKWWVKRDHGLRHGNYQLYSLYLQLTALLLTDMSAEYKDLLIHNDIRWLTKGNALKWFCELREEILVFLRKLKKAGQFLSLMENDEFTAAVCFLSDVFHHLNQLNMELQGRDKTVTQLVERLHAFQKKAHTFLCWPVSRQNAPLLHTEEIRLTNHWGEVRIYWLTENKLCHQVWWFQYLQWSDEICEGPIQCEC